MFSGISNRQRRHESSESSSSSLGLGSFVNSLCLLPASAATGHASSSTSSDSSSSTDGGEIGSFKRQRQQAKKL